MNLFGNDIKNDALLMIRGTTLALKFQTAAEKAARDAGAKDIDAHMEKKLKKKMEALMKTLPPNDQIEALKAYKKAVGPEMWDDIKNNPSLPQLVKAWAKGEAEKVLPKFIEIFKSVLPADHDFTDDDIKVLIDFMTAVQE